MNSEQDAQLRYLIRKSFQLPQPDWDLFARTSRRWSRAESLLRGTKTPIKKEMKKQDDKTGKGGEK